MEFHISKKMRDKCKFDLPLFSTNGNVIFSNFTNIRKFTTSLNEIVNPKKDNNKFISAGKLNAMGLIDETFHIVCKKFRAQKNNNAFNELYKNIENVVGVTKIQSLLVAFSKEFPPLSVYKNELSITEYLDSETDGISNKIITLEELILLILANENPAFKPFYVLFDDKNLKKNPAFSDTWNAIKKFFEDQPLYGKKANNLIAFLKEPVIASPYSLKGQIEYITKYWKEVLEEEILKLLSGIDMIAEEEKTSWSTPLEGPPPMESYKYENLMNEYEHFTEDKDWMGNVVLMAKTVLVWLDQLTKQYGYEISRLDQIPDEELDLLQSRGFTSLWLIGIWERSWGSKRIKQINGNPEAASSAYSLHDYEIAENIGGWQALENLRSRLNKRGIRIAADMVPNHTALDSKWVTEKPHLFVQRKNCPFPSYTFNGENLSLDPRVSIYLEDNYYNKTDCAVVYKRVDNSTGDTTYLYHGNDGTGLPWNDTAQIDFLNPEAREEVIQKILHVARNFSVIRFDAAMVLAKKHIRRLWYPQHGQGGDIASRGENALTSDAFEAAIPNEFWREVVDRIAIEIPDTLLLAEAFWMMEGYFVRTLGMHRVYNSAFMNMLKKEENFKYRETIKNTINFDPQILKRFVNFMNNPDEETAVAQFGKGDKYFGVCTLMVTMPGLPMFGHGQIEGFGEKYGMEYTKAYWNEDKDWGLIEHHNRVIFPLMKKRYVFSDSENFRFYDVWAGNTVNENIFAYSNFCGNERAVVFYNNAYNKTAGWIKNSCEYATKDTTGNVELHTQHIASSLGLTNKDNCFVIFKEVQSGLQFIRSSKEMYEKGLFLVLNEYEYQVLMDIVEVEDGVDGTYALLCLTLEGKGVKSIARAKDELLYGKLYKSLEAFITEDFLANITKKETPTLDIVQEYKPQGLEFIEILIDFINGNYGAKDFVTIKKTIRVEAELVWIALEKRLEKLLVFCNKAKKSKQKDSFTAKLYAKLAESEKSLELLTVFSIVICIKDILEPKTPVEDAIKILQHWSLDTKSCELVFGSDDIDKEIVENFNTLLTLAAQCEKTIKNTQLQTEFADIVKIFCKTPLGISRLGLNKFDGDIWFNKELVEEFVFEATILYTIFRAKTTDIKAIEKLYNGFLENILESEYKFENFIELLEK